MYYSTDFRKIITPPSSSVYIFVPAYVDVLGKLISGSFDQKSLPESSFKSGSASVTIVTTTVYRTL